MRSSESDDGAVGRNRRLGQGGQGLATYLFVLLLGFGLLRAVGQQLDHEASLALHVLMPIVAAIAGSTVLGLRRKKQRQGRDDN